MLSLSRRPWGLKGEKKVAEFTEYLEGGTLQGFDEDGAKGVSVL